MSSRDEKELLEFYNSYMDALSSAQVESIMSHMSEDTIMYPPNQPAFSGLKDIRQHYGKKTSGIIVLDWGHKVERMSVSDSGDLGYVIMTVTHAVEMNGENHVFDNKGVKVFQKVDDKWTLVTDCWNDNK
jgi:ketosteroid isomerase-like protein